MKNKEETNFPGRQGKRIIAEEVKNIIVIQKIKQKDKQKRQKSTLLEKIT